MQLFYKNIFINGRDLDLNKLLGKFGIIVRLE